MSNNKYPPMPHFEYFTSAIEGGKIFDEQMFENCIMIVPNKDGSYDTYDFQTEKHLDHFNLNK